jgi:hypothetical protein
MRQQARTLRGFEHPPIKSTEMEMADFHGNGGFGATSTTDEVLAGVDLSCKRVLEALVGERFPA